MKTKILLLSLVYFSLFSKPLKVLARSSQALYQQAERFRLGRTIRRDLNRAWKAYVKSCRKNHARACWRQALLLKTPTLFKVHLKNSSAVQKEQKRLYHKACRRGWADACVEHIKMTRTQSSLKTLARLYRRYCKRGSGTACYRLFLIQHKQHTAQNIKTLSTQQKWWKKKKQLLLQTHSKLRRGCNHKMEKDCFLLGYLHYQGLLPKGRAHAAQLFEKACRLSHANGCDFRALMAGSGLGIPKNLTDARTWHQKACNLGLGDGCTHLGGLYFRGLGGKMKLKQARTLFRRACTWNHAQGCLLLGEMMIRGEGGKRNVSGTLNLFKKSCQLRHAEGCRRYKALKPIVDVNQASKKNKTQ